MLIPTRQYYRHAGRETIEYTYALPTKLTLRKNYTRERWDKGSETLFREVSIVPFEDVYRDCARLLQEARHGQRQETRPQLLTRMADHLRGVVLEHWKPEKFHVILHSSGYDSRILSWMIKRLHAERGDEWLGDVLFVCSKWEARTFKAIMQYEGWDESQYTVIREEAKPSEYYAPSLTEFEGAWERANGVAGIPVNLFWYPVWLLQEDGRLPVKDSLLQVWNGQWGNTVSTASKAASGPGTILLLRQFYYSVLFSRSFKGGEVIRPYADAGYLKLIATSSVIDEHDHLRRELSDHLNPDLAGFINEAADGDRHRRIADPLLSQMQKDYAASWYAKATGRPFGLKWKTTEFQGAWSRWTAASLCEKLREEGYQIEVGK